MRWFYATFSRLLRVMICVSCPIVYSCSSDHPRYLYPSSLSEEIKFLCSIAYSRDHSTNRSWNESPPEAITVSQDYVTVFFSNHQSYSIVRDPQSVVPPGSYRCRK